MKVIVTGAAGFIGVKHLVYASSSSVSGSNKNISHSTEDKVVKPE